MEVQISELYVIQEYRRWIKTIFGFSLCITPLLVTLVAYFGTELEDLADGKLPESSNVIDLSPKGWTKTISCIGVIQENLMEILLQSSLPYILLPIVCAYYCAPYPK